VTEIDVLVDYMKFIKIVMVLILVLTLFSALIPATSAERDSLCVVITAEDKIYYPEDTIDVEVRIYDKGILVNPDYIRVTVETHWTNPEEEVTMYPLVYIREAMRLGRMTTVHILMCMSRKAQMMTIQS
jgi:hypothetical protein